MILLTIYLEIENDFTKYFNLFNAEATFVQSARTQRFKKKSSKPCHVGIHWIALAEYPFARVSVIFQVFYIILYWPN